MRTAEERNCLREEMEYHEWRECPQWYCVKTILGKDGTMKSEIVADENTGVPIALQCDKKPLDGTYETAAETIYYTYHAGYEAAAQQIAVMSLWANSANYLNNLNHLITLLRPCGGFFFAESRTDFDRLHH